jgi:exosortase
VIEAPTGRALLAFLCAAALWPVVHYLYQTWTQGTLGGAGAGMVALPAALGLAVLARRRPPPDVDWPAEAAPWVMAAGAGLYAVGAALARLDANAWLIAGPGLALGGFGLLFALRGARTAARYAFPIGFALFALPWEIFLRELDPPLQIASARLGVWMLEAFGHELRWWNPYTFWNDRYYLIVNETCSGMNMLVTLTMYTTVFGWLTLRTLPRRAALLVLVLPLALVANGARVAVIWWMGAVGGDDLAMGFWHTGSAYVIFLPVFWVLYRAARWLGRGEAGPRVQPAG